MNFINPTSKDTPNHPIYQATIYKRVSTYVNFFERVLKVYSKRIIPLKEKGSVRKRKKLGKDLIVSIQRNFKHDCIFRPFVDVLQHTVLIKIVRGYDRHNRESISYKLCFDQQEELGSMNLKVRSTDDFCELFKRSLQLKGVYTDDIDGVNLPDYDEN